MPKNKLIVALDVDTQRDAENIVSQLRGVVGWYKVGMQLYYGAGPGIIDFIHQTGSKVFLDLKLLDIPNTVASAARALTRYGAAIIDLHASGGKEMMLKAFEAVHEESERLGIVTPLVVGVTVLTSISQEMLNQDIGIPGTPAETVVRWAKTCAEVGLDGVVASGQEAALIKANTDLPVIITPGIRPAGDREPDDQKRVLTPGKAIALGSTHLVVGRPITRAGSPREAAERILMEIEESSTKGN